MRKILDLIRLFCFSSKLKLARGMQYRVDFFLGLAVSLGLSSLGPIFQYLIFSNTRGYPNWNLNQIILMQGVIVFWLGIKDVLFGEVRINVESMVRSGEFDRVLLKPYPPIGILLTGGFYYQGIGSVLSGLVIIIYSINAMSLSITLWQILFLIIFLISGVVFYMAITVIYCTIIIMVVFMGRIGEIIDKFLQFAQYPLEIFPRMIRVIFITIFPVAAWAYFPTQILLNRVGISAVIGVISCFIVLFISLFIWNINLKKYTSAGG